MDNLKDKLLSRKFWMAAAAALASIGTAVTGIATANDDLIAFGTVCLIVSQAIFSFCEAYVDGASVSAKTVTVTATTSNAATVQALTGTAKADTAKDTAKSEANNG